MPKLLIAALGALLLGSASPTAQAQAGGAAEQRAAQFTSQMREQLSLTAAQEPAVAALNLKYTRQMGPVLAGGRSLSTLRQLRALQQAKDQEMKAVLTKDQCKQYEKLRDEQRQQLRNAASSSPAGQLGKLGEGQRPGRPGQLSREVAAEPSI